MPELTAGASAAGATKEDDVFLARSEDRPLRASGER